MEIEDFQKYPIYWDPELKKAYWVSWFESGNNDIPTRHFIGSQLPPPQGGGFLGEEL